MKFKLSDLYSDYPLSSCAATTATGMSALMEREISHDQISRMLNQRRLRPAGGKWSSPMLKLRTRQNHYTLKTHLHLSALQQAFHALALLIPVRLEASSA